MEAERLADYLRTGANAKDVVSGRSRLGKAVGGRVSFGRGQVFPVGGTSGLCAAPGSGAGWTTEVTSGTGLAMLGSSGRALAGRPTVCVLLAVSMVAACSSAAEQDQAAPRKTTAATSPGGSGLTAAVEKYIDNLYSPGARNLRAVLVSVDGQVLVERYWNSSPTTTNNVFSVTKSVTGTLAGIALGDHSLRGLDQPLRELLPAYAPDMTPRARLGHPSPAAHHDRRPARRRP